MLAVPRRDCGVEICDSDGMNKSISELRERIAQTNKTKGGHRRYPAELRDDIVKLALAWTRRGKPLPELVRRLGVHRDTLNYWLQSQSHDAEHNTPVRPVRVVDTEPAPAAASAVTRPLAVTRPVRVVEMEPAPAAASAVTRSILLRSGARIEGLSMEELITLARALA
jgi:transposase-like protein